MKIKYICLGIIGLSLFFTACSSVVKGNDNMVVVGKVEEEKEDMEKKVIMTEEQKALLIGISVNEERVRRGELLDWQKEVLRQYDYVMDYLNKKYPSYTFHIVYCEPKNKLNQAYSKFNFTEESDKEGYYDLYLEIEDGKYFPEDNFYGHIIEPIYEEKLMELLKQENIPCNRVEASLNYAQGENFNETMDVDEVINGNISMDQVTEFFIEGNDIQNESYQDIINKIQALIDKKNIYGGYFVTFYDAKNGEEELFKGDFNNFD